MTQHSNKTLYSSNTTINRKKVKSSTEPFNQINARSKNAQKNVILNEKKEKKIESTNKIKPEYTPNEQHKNRHSKFALAKYQGLNDPLGEKRPRSHIALFGFHYPK